MHKSEVQLAFDIACEECGADKIRVMRHTQVVEATTYAFGLDAGRAKILEGEDQFEYIWLNDIRPTLDTALSVFEAAVRDLIFKHGSERMRWRRKPSLRFTKRDIDEWLINGRLIIALSAEAEALLPAGERLE